MTVVLGGVAGWYKAQVAVGPSPVETPPLAERAQLSDVFLYIVHEAELHVGRCWVKKRWLGTFQTVIRVILTPASAVARVAASPSLVT